MFQMTPAPTIEIAIGMKIIDLANFSKRLRSASTAISKPKITAQRGAEDDPHHVVAEGREHVAVGERPPGSSSGRRSSLPSGVEQADPEGADGGQGQVPDQDGDRRADEDERLQADAPLIAQAFSTNQLETK